MYLSEETKHNAEEVLRRRSTVYHTRRSSGRRRRCWFYMVSRHGLLKVLRLSTHTFTCLRSNFAVSQPPHEKERERERASKKKGCIRCNVIITCFCKEKKKERFNGQVHIVAYLHVVTTAQAQSRDASFVVQRQWLAPRYSCVVSDMLANILREKTTK